ncbi:MAG: methionine synthase, partial [Thermoproteota archaeon]|nr:methionine synthase [Thermoproteota archaeon]
MCGGAAINSDYINRIAKSDGKIYKPGIFYCKTAFDGLKVMNNLTSKQKSQFLDEWNEKIQNWSERKYNEKPITTSTSLGSSSVKAVQKKPAPPKLNYVYRFAKEDIPLDKVWELVNKKSLFVLSWGLRGKNTSMAHLEHEDILKEWKKRVLEENLFEPQAAYGYFKCRRVDDNKLLVKYQTEKNLEDQILFEFPRSSQGKRLCLADYFDRDSDDVVAFQSVTMGKKVADTIEKWNSQNLYSDAYYLHGFAVESTEALADWINNQIKKELGLENGGLRYSWGYPSCPDISQHFLVWKLINPTLSGMTLTPVGQINPEFSTAAIVVHHPLAEYFTL